MPTYNTPRKAWIAERTQPPWSPYLRLSDLSGGGIPDADPNSQFVSISEPSTGVLRLTFRTNGVSTDGYTEGIRWNVSQTGLWSPQAQHFKADGRQGLLTWVEESAPPALYDNPIVSMGVLKTTAPTTAGCSAGISYHIVNERRTIGNTPTATAFGAGGTTQRVVIGYYTLAQGDGDAGTNIIGHQTGFSAAGATTGGGNAVGGSAILWTTNPAEVQLFITAMYRSAVALTTTIDMKFRWTYFHMRPNILAP